MPDEPDNLQQLNQRPRVKAPLFERVQDLIFQFDIGYGVQWFRLAMFVTVMLVVILLYMGTQFYGFRDRESMDLGQLGRNLAMGRGYVTRYVRPVDVAQLTSIEKQPLTGNETMLPELWTPPVYPWVLAMAFKFSEPTVDMVPIEQRMQLPAQTLPAIGEWDRSRGLYANTRAEALRMDRTVVVVAWVFFALSLGALYVLARELFDQRVAFLSAVLYLLCDPMLAACVNGAPAAWLAFLFLIGALALLKAEQWAETKRSVYWVSGALGVCGLVVGLGMLTRYAFVGVLIPLVVYVCVSMPQVKRVVKLGALVGMFLVVVGPWVARNWMVSKRVFGMANAVLLEAPSHQATEEKLQIQVEREMGGLPRVWLRQLAVRGVVNLDRLYRGDLKETGVGFLFAFFVASLLHRFKREDVFRLRRFVFWSVILVAGFVSFAGAPKWNFFAVFAPLVIVYGVAFFLVMFERLQFRARWMRRGMVGLFVVVNCLPFVFTVLPPAPPTPNPPCDAGIVAAVGRTFREEELIATDLPWAVAWYADRSATLMPVDEQTFLQFNDDIHGLTGIYLTQATHMDLELTKVVVGYQQFWLNLYLRPNPNLPLRSIAPLMEHGEQVLLSSRPRWIQTEKLTSP